MNAATKTLLILLIGVTLLAYLPVRDATFVYEDEVYLTPAQRPITWGELTAPRGLTLLSFRLNYLVGGLEPRGYHAINLWLFLLIGLGVFAIARQFLPPAFALLATGLCWLHPLQTESVAYVTGRAELLAALGVVITTWAVLQEPFRWPWRLVAMGGVVVALGGKDLGVLALPLALWTRYQVAPWPWASWRVLSVGLGLLVIFVGLLAWTAGARLWGNAYLLTSQRQGLGYLAVQVVALLLMLKLVLVPIGQTIDHDLEFITKAWGLSLLAGALLVAVALWTGRARWPRVGWALGWVAIAIAPRLFVPIAEYLNEHQVFTPFLAVWIALAAGVQAVSARGWPVEPLCADSSAPSA